MTSRWLWAGAVSALGLLSLVACGSDSTGGGGGGSAGSATGGSSGSTSSGGAAGNGNGGTAGEANGGSAGSPASGGAAGEDGGTPTAGDHLLISEVGLLTGASEFVEIYNPTSSEVDLTDYYLADNSAYHKLTSGPWNPVQTDETDWLARFPDGAKIPAGGVLVISLNSGFETAYGDCPDFVLNASAAPLACGGGEVPAMRIPANGSVGNNEGSLISNDREMVVLFTWNGSSATVKDVDYVTWGRDAQAPWRIDKTAVTGYATDTAIGAQKPADPGLTDGGSNEKLSIERCAIEPGEKLTGGNGITGHDETSEDFGAGFQSQGAPTPGTKNRCLP
jgi:hypothetical protein